MRPRDLFLHEREQDQTDYSPEQFEIMETNSLNLVNSSILPTKGNVTVIASHIIQDVLEGNMDCFEVVARLAAITSTCEAVKEGIRQHITDELSKYGGGIVGKLDAKIQSSEVGTKYDYSPDPVWLGICEKMKPLEEAKKQRETFLKGVSRMFIETDIETGESYEVYPPIKTSTSSFKVTLGK
ncbi:hypothetical protein ACE38W_14805 [Chitinophaga sp. Hz27]|uniref:hypothetical protein n=1 Tax=Chitinophaga sp. Hz27 TaxID=3347169 RepID=UPI0035DBEFAD